MSFILKKLGFKKNKYTEWAERKFTAPSPHFVKQVVILRNGKLGATWVETGTYKGATTQLLAVEAKHVYSIEPEPLLFSNAKNKFKDKKNITLINGLSEDIFPDLLPTLKGDVCFWLDGHYSAGSTHKGPQETPIREELIAISNILRELTSAVIMVDDVRCFNPANPEYTSYPSLDYLVDWARENSLHWHIEHDIFIAKKYKQ